MRQFNKLGFAAALLAGSALSGAAFAQEATQPKVLKEGTAAPSAKSNAPGQQKLDGQPAAEAAPGQKMKSGEADSAAEAAPGQEARRRPGGRDR